MKHCHFQQNLSAVALEDIQWVKSLVPDYVLLHRSYSVSNRTNELWFLRELCPVDWFFFFFLCSKIWKALPETGIHNKPPSCRSFVAWQKNAFPTADTGICCYLGVTTALRCSSAVQWMVNALRGKVGSWFCCAFCCCHVAVHDSDLTK